MPSTRNISYGNSPSPTGVCHDLSNKRELQSLYCTYIGGHVQKQRHLDVRLYSPTKTPAEDEDSPTPVNLKYCFEKEKINKEVDESGNKCNKEEKKAEEEYNIIIDYNKLKKGIIENCACLKCARLGVENVKLANFESMAILEEEIISELKLFLIPDQARKKNKRYFREKKKAEMLINKIEEIMETSRSNFDATYMSHKNCDLHIEHTSVGLASTINAKCKNV